jgi:hypothetical protein
VIASLGVALVLIVALVLVQWLRPDLLIRGPAIDTATAYLTAVERQDYHTAYRLMSSGLQASESESAFASSAREIAATDGALTSYQVRSMQSDHSLTVVTLALSRRLRGDFTAHISVTQEAGGHWRISGADDL